MWRSGPCDVTQHAARHLVSVCASVPGPESSRRGLVVTALESKYFELWLDVIPRWGFLRLMQGQALARQSMGMPRALRAIACNCVQSHDICSKDQCVCSGLEVAVEGVVAAATVEEAVEGAATPGIRAAVEVAVDVAVEGVVAVAVGVVAAAAWAVGVDVAAVAAVVVAADAGLVVDAEDATTAVEAVASSLDVVDVVWETTAWAEFSCGLTMALLATQSFMSLRGVICSPWPSGLAWRSCSSNCNFNSSSYNSSKLCSSRRPHL